MRLIILFPIFIHIITQKIILLLAITSNYFVVTHNLIIMSIYQFKVPFKQTSKFLWVLDTRIQFLLLWRSRRKNWTLPLLSLMMSSMFKIMLKFTSCFTMGKAQRWGPFPRVRAIFKTRGWKKQPHLHFCWKEVTSFSTKTWNLNM